jgi:lipoate-protein ligase A
MTTAKWKILSAVPSWDIINKMTTRSPFEWRLILDPPQSGPLNMAMDEALLHHAGQKYSPPTLRLYAWDQPTLSWVILNHQAMWSMKN